MTFEVGEASFKVSHSLKIFVRGESLLCPLKTNIILPVIKTLIVPTSSLRAVDVVDVEIDMPLPV